MSNTLEERLKTHSSAFDGLLSLIPAKYYYDDATQDQWQQKKNSKKESQQHKRAKLDPDNKAEADEYTNSHASAKDVMSNKAVNAKKVVLPKRAFGNISETKPGVNSQEESEEEDQQQESQESEENVEIPDMDVDDNESGPELINTSASLIFDDDGNEIELEQEKKKEQQKQTQAKKSKVISPEEKKKRDENLMKLREKLSAKIAGFKEKRKALGTKVPGAPKSREQILEERKRKEELKKAEKLKRKHSEMEAEEEDSESEASGDEDENDQEGGDNQVLFGNIVFQDGSRVTSDLSKLRSTVEKKKQKGPANNDIKAHLLKLEQKKRKLEQLSPEDKKAHEEKEKWQRVMSQAEGVKVKDDEKLLRKALKRKEKQKLKSEIEWKERKQVVKDTVSARAKRREENLKARRDNKGKKSKNQPRLRKFTGTVNKAAKKRAGFEGSAKSKKK